MGIFDLFKRTQKPSLNDVIKYAAEFNSAESVSNQKPTSSQDNLNEQFRKLSFKNQKDLMAGDLASYAINLYRMSEIHRKEKHYNDQLNLLFISSYIHLSGYSDPEMYNFFLESNCSSGMVTPILPPANVRAIGVASRRLHLSSDELKERFLSSVDVTLTPIHIFTKEECADVILLYVEGDEAKAEKKIEAAKRRFIKEIRKNNK